MAKKKVCISFDYEHDRNYKNLLKAWNNNDNFEFSLNDKTPNEIDSNDYSVIKGVLTKKIKSATYLLVIIGEYANEQHPRSTEIGEINWINWEINKAKDENVKLVAVKINSSYESPSAIYGSGAEWAMSFSQDKIIEALNRAANK